MATRLRKSRRQRGTRFCGWGQIGQHRASGSRGGVGGAGKHKHFYIRTVIEEPEHFGHEQFHALRKSDISKWLNLKDLNQLMKYSKATEEGKIILDLNELGYGKLLGSWPGRCSCLRLKLKRFQNLQKIKLMKPEARCWF